MQTAAAADPRVFVGESAAHIVRDLRSRARKSFAGWIEERQDELFEELIEHADSLPRSGQIDLWPLAPLIGDVANVDELKDAFEQLPMHWQLDVLQALEDLVD